MNSTEKEQLKQQIIAEEEAKEITYKSGNQEIKLSIPIIKKYLTDNKAVTNQEAMTFLQLCKFNRMNPFAGDVYLIKYGTSAAKNVPAKGHFMKVANRSPNFEGMECGIIIKKQDGKIEDREGSVFHEDEKLIGGWCKALIKNKSFPKIRVLLSEYIGKKGTGETNSQWKKMPATMIRKVAIVHALREAFPEDLGGLSDESELPAIKNNANGNTGINEANKEELNNLLTKKEGTIIEGEVVKTNIEKPVEAKPDKTQEALKQNNMFDEKHAKEQGFTEDKIEL